MKTYRLALAIGGFVFIDADRHELQEGMIRFYRGDSIFAEYPKGLVKGITEPTVPLHARLSRRNSEERE